MQARQQEAARPNGKAYDCQILNQDFSIVIQLTDFYISDFMS